MSKVKDQVLPGSDISYIDSTGQTHYDADLIRHIMPNAYPLPSLNPTSVAKRSLRYHKPAHQGRGSVKQYPERRCFSECSAFWNTIPDACPEYCTEQMDATLECDIKTVNTSKQQVYNAKVEQGVMCSYYDLFMGCCLFGCQCVSLIIDGQEGEPVCKVNSDMDCFKCPQPDPDLPNDKDNACIKCTPSISYTTQQMQGGGSQALSYTVDEECPDAPPCPPECVKWEIISGGGSFNNDPLISVSPVPRTTGFNPIYYAPANNPNCENNPTIEMTDCRGQKSILNIAVSKVSNAYLAARQWSSDGVFESRCCVPPNGPPPPSGPVLTTHEVIIFCDGSEATITPNSHCVNDIGCSYNPLLPCTTTVPVCDFTLHDVRTEQNKIDGCCPEQLL